MVDFPGCPVSMAFAWSVIDGVVHGPDLLLADSGEAGALGKHSRISPSVFPLPPRRHGWRGRAKQNTAPAACSTFSKSADSIPRSRVTVRLSGCLRSAPISTSATSRLACVAQRPPESRPLLRPTSVTRHAPAPLPTVFCQVVIGQCGVSFPSEKAVGFSPVRNWPVIARVLLFHCIRA